MTKLKLPKLVFPVYAVLAFFSCPALADDSGTTALSVPIDVSSVTSVVDCDLTFAEDVIRLHYNGGMMAFDVSRSEFFLKNRLTGESNIESLIDEMSSAEEMREFVYEEDRVWGQECKLVLYKHGLPQVEENRLLLSRKIEIKLDLETASFELLQSLGNAAGVEVLSSEVSGRGVAMLQAECPGSAIKASEILTAHEGVIFARPLTVMPMVKCSFPTDQFYTPGDQDYVHHDRYGLVANVIVADVWCGSAPLSQAYFGRSVSISLLDDGIQGEHPDLDRNYSYRDDTDFVDGDNDGGPGSGADDHGTQMAGIMVARHNNGGVAGIAPSAEIFSTRVQGASDPGAMSEAIEHESSTVDVIVVGFVPGGNYVDISEALEDSLEKMAERNDVPICMPAGDGGGFSRMDYDRLSSHRYTMAFAGDGVVSEPGASLIATSAGQNLGTTDLTGEDGADTGDYSFTFSGTSPAAACGGGLIALMKDARPNLGWRDYQEILLLTSFPFDTSFAPNDAFVITPLGDATFQFSYNWGAGALTGWSPVGPAAVTLAEVWARLPDTATTYIKADERESINEDIGSDEQTFLFDFTDNISREQNLRIEHIEVFLEWEEPPSGSAAELLPAYVFLVDPYYLSGPENDSDGIDTRPLPTAPRLGHGSLLSDIGDGDSRGINTPVEWTYTTLRHWGLINTGGLDPTGGPDDGGFVDTITKAGVWELDVAVEPLVVLDDDGEIDEEESVLTRRLISAEITMYGTEFNLPPAVTSASISSSGNPGVDAPRTAFVDEDLLVNDIIFFDAEGDPLTAEFVWQELDEDGVTWVDLDIPVDRINVDCEYDQYIKITTEDDRNGSTYGKYFIVTDTDGSTIGFHIQEPGSTTIPAGAAAADRTVAITTVARDEGAAGIAVDIAAAVNAAGGGITGVIEGEDDIITGPPLGPLLPNEMAITYPAQFGNVVLPATENEFILEIELMASQDITGNCFGTISARLDASETETETKYRVVISPSDEIREGFIFTSPEIIVNSRPITQAVHAFEYEYDADLWIETVPPDTLPPFVFINEVSQGSGDSTTNQEWVEMIVNFTADMRGYRISNDIAGFDLTMTQNAIWEEVPFGTVIVVYNGDQRDPLLPPDTALGDFSTTSTWVISASNGALFDLPANGDGWGEFSNRDCTPEDSGCDGAHAAILTRFDARDPVHGVSFNGDETYVVAGLAASGESVYFDGNSDDLTTDPTAWQEDDATMATPGIANSVNNQAALAEIILEAKTSIPTYRFYPGDGSQENIDPASGALLGTADVVASDLVPGLSIDRKTGLITGTPDVPAGGVFTIKIQRFHSFASEIQIYDLTVLALPPLVDSEDVDNDGLINLLEEALGSDPYSSQVGVLPTSGLTNFGAFRLPNLTFRRLKGGVTQADGTYLVGDLLYAVEVSTDLRDWQLADSPAQTALVDSVDSPATVEVVTLRLANIGTTTVRHFMRLRITRIPAA